MELTTKEYQTIILRCRELFEKNITAQTLNCKGQLIDLSVPKIMGILNLTSDSF